MLVRAGEDGADALIEQIAAISGQNERRVYFDALLQLQAGVPTLIHMLGDARWFVARNAAELLGEMQTREAEPQLTELLRHTDDRVRRAATSALMRLGTTRAMNAIQEALKDGAPAMRMQAAAALVARKDVKTAATLVRALEEEKDDEVQAAFLLALGKLGTARRGAATGQGGGGGARAVQEEVDGVPRGGGAGTRRGAHAGGDWTR